MQILSSPLEFKKSIKMLVSSTGSCKRSLENVNRSACLIFKLVESKA